MSDLAELVSDLAEVQGVNSIVLTDESGSPFELAGVTEDDEKAAIAAFVGSGVNHIAGTLDLEDFQGMTMSYEGGAFLVYPVGSLYLGITLSESKKLFKVESKINQVLSEHII